MELTVFLLLILGAFVAALISGVAGFGGAILLLPLLVHAVGAERAVPLLTLAQLAGNGTRAWIGRREIAWVPVRVFVSTAVPFAVAGALLFTALRHGLIAHFVGGALVVLALLPSRRREDASGPAPTARLVWGGAATGLLSGMAGSAGPLGAAVFLTLGLAPGAYLASEAVTALAMHVTKMAIYGVMVPIGWHDLGCAAALSAAMVGGTHAGRRLADRLSRDRFRQVVQALLVAVGLKMLIWG